MLVATFNCNSVRQRLGIVLDWLERHKPDALALQETKCTDADFPADAFAQAGWQAFYRGEKSYNGVAWITRKKPDSVLFGLQDGEDDKAQTSETRLAHLELAGVHLLNAYVPQGQDLDSPKFQFKLAWLARFRRYLEKRLDPAKDRVLWVGDLNVAPTPIDVHDSKKIWPHVCHCQEVVDAFAAVTSWGFVDLFRKHLPDAGTFTFWDYRVPNSVSRNIGWRIDHVLETAPLAARSQDVLVDVAPRQKDKPSDHTFVAARFA